MLWEPIENRYRKENKMFHTGAFAIAAGVVGVGAAATSGIMGMQAAKRAAGAQASAGKKLQRQQKKATSAYEQRMNEATSQFEQQQAQLRAQIEAIDPNINIKPFDMSKATPEAIENAALMTASMLEQLDKTAPGLRAQYLENIGIQMSGQPLRPEQIGEIQRLVAQGGGAASYNPATAGRGIVPQRGTFDYARALGGAMYDVTRQAMGSFEKWTTLAGQYILQQPFQLMQLGEQARRTDAEITRTNIENQFKKAGMLGDVGAQTFGARTGLAQSLYGAQTGMAQSAFDIAIQNAQARAAQDFAAQQAVQGIGSALSGAISGAGSAMGQVGAARGASTTPMQSGFYAGEIGAANAYNVAPSQLSYQKPTGGFLGIGGQQGGFYYTPSGVYGR